MWSLNRRLIVILLLLSLAPVAVLLSSFFSEPEYTLAQLRELYSSGDSKKWPLPNIDESIKPDFEDLGVLGKVNFPTDNPFTESKSELGKLLFFDRRLSASKQISCASCHDPQLGFGDGKSLAHGHDRQVGKRNAMTLYNVGHYTSWMWDGRAPSLEEQVLMPIQDHVEMNMHLDSMLQHIDQIKGYHAYFVKAYGDEEVSVVRIQQALATYLRTINSYPTKFDRFISGTKDALNDQELMGLHLFRTKARCINCHNTPLFSDSQFHNDGQALYGTRQEDLGHYHVSGKQLDVGAFRTPSLRNVALTGPWMHHGNFPTLRDVVELYNLGNPAPIQRRVVVDENLRPIPSPLLKKLDLSREEVDAVVAFMQALSAPVQRRINTPELPD
ncbi:cytochrome-c peroxidase [Sphingobacterium corticibacter]|uniref:Methylamine utilization protein MauG n=1 Tax=Sphingobacterium corticibacter TaxID=2171749 RepID=A0A2T8HNU7_9SPHI|nr:cytochrome c peroxidase [Sphingobacterium corticibacter]PVH27090.1 cytochrome-c peroxidase [Sphingobacterium corticibacter]